MTRFGKATVCNGIWIARKGKLVRRGARARHKFGDDVAVSGWLNEKGLDTGGCLYLAIASEFCNKPKLPIHIVNNNQR